MIYILYQLAVLRVDFCSIYNDPPEVLTRQSNDFCSIYNDPPKSIFLSRQSNNVTNLVSWKDVFLICRDERLQFRREMRNVNTKEARVFSVTSDGTSGSVKEQINQISPLRVFGICEFWHIRLFCMTLFDRQRFDSFALLNIRKRKNHFQFGIRHNLLSKVISSDFYKLDRG